MSRYLDVSNINTMHVREGHEGTRYVELGIRSCQCTFFRDSRYWGKQAKQVSCPRCSATGKVTKRVFYAASWGRSKHQGERGYWGRETVDCKACYATGRYGDWRQAEVCQTCQGSCLTPQNICDTLPAKYVDMLEVRVYREGEHESVTQGLWMRQTACYSLSDYGRYKNLTDAEIIADVRKSNTHVQASKLTKQDKAYPTTYKFAHHIGVLCQQGGYEVMAVFDDSELVPISETPKYHARRKADGLIEAGGSSGSGVAV